MSPELQKIVINALFAGDTAVLSVLGQSRLQAEQQLAIYRDSMRAGLSAALKQTYPVCVMLLGEQCFDAFAFQFIESHPSTDPDLCLYGAEFPDFLEGVHALGDLAYLADVARLEWYWHFLFFAAEGSDGLHSERHGLAALGSVSASDFKRLVFCLPDPVAMLKSEYPIDKIWDMHQSDAINRAMIFDIEEQQRVQPVTRLLLRRIGLEFNMCCLSEIEYFILSRFYQKQSLGEVVDAYTQDYHERNFESDLTSLFESGYLNSFYLAGNASYSA